MVVCSLVRVNIVHLRVQLRPSPVQSSGPAAVSFFFFFSSLFLSVAKPREPRQFFPPVGIRRSLHVFHVALSVCSACLGESPAGFSPSLLFVSLLSSVAKPSLRELFFLAASCQRVKLVLFILFPRFVSFGSSLSRKPWFCFPAVSIFFLSPISVACLSKRSDLFPDFSVVESQISFAVSFLLQAVVSAPPCSCFPANLLSVSVSPHLVFCLL